MAHSWIMTIPIQLPLGLRLKSGKMQQEDFEISNSKDGIGKWLAILMAPGSSLGGARPKANILDEDGNLWIVRLSFPSKNDNIDKGAWEFLAYELAIKAGIQMAPSKTEKVIGKFHTFFTKRFDREKGGRSHFSSAIHDG